MTNGDELRPVTALFADIVGSTSLGERLGPDEVKALVGECVSRMTRAVEEFGGIVQAYMGDGICAYFGVPTAHEDDPERSARAALRILEVVGEYATDVEAAWGIAGFNVRVGINTGRTAVGLVGGADPQTVALGDTTNVAARLQSAADPGTIVVGEGTARRLANRFQLEPLGEVTVKGRTEPVTAWRLGSPRETSWEIAAHPLVDREAELARLGQVVSELTAGRGQVLLVTGESGMGKTRMLGELRTIAGEAATWLEGRSSSFGGEMLTGPFVQMLRSWIGAEDGEAEIAVRTKLRARLGVLFGDHLGDVLPFLSRFLSVRLDPADEDRLRALDPEALAAGVRGGYRLWIERLASAKPVVAALDDLHWADRSTREVAEELLPVTDRAPLLVAAAFRADPASEAWTFRLQVQAEYAHRSSEIQLQPLSPEGARRFVDAVGPAEGFDEATREMVVSRAEGNPLYVEEIVRSLAESGALVRDRTWTLSVRAEDLLPPALENLLVTRIDRLDAGARQLAQAAAVIGRSFPVRVLERVVGQADLADDLAVLLRADIIREVARFPEFQCTFRHALLHEAALSTLTGERRRELYGRVAAAFEDLFASSIEDHLEVLGHYYARSDDLGRALAYFERAGERAAGLNATEQAAVMWKRARKVAVRLEDPESEKRITERLASLGAD